MASPKVIPMEGNIHLSWIPPFTLDLTNVEPDLQYLLQVINISDRNNPAAIPCIECPLNETEYEFTLANPNPCNTFEFSVAAKNGAGLGNMSAPMIGYFLTSKYIV